MKAIVIGYFERNHQSEGRVLYAGHDKGKADDAVNAGGPGILRTTLFLHPKPFSNRNFDTPNESGIQPEMPGATEEDPDLAATFAEFNKAVAESILFDDESPADSLLSYIAACRVVNASIPDDETEPLWKLAEESRSLADFINGLTDALDKAAEDTLGLRNSLALVEGSNVTLRTERDNLLAASSAQATEIERLKAIIDAAPPKESASPPTEKAADKAEDLKLDSDPKKSGKK